MELSKEQLSSIYADAALSTELVCPFDGAVIGLNRERTTKPDGTIERIRVAACPQCALKVVLRREDDPLYSSFREWDTEEQHAIAATYRVSYEDCRCPRTERNCARAACHSIPP